MSDIVPDNSPIVSIHIPFGIGSAEWAPAPAERQAAWALYVELVTRIDVHDVSSETGFSRETLSSLHSLFAITREVLRGAGPHAGCSRESVGGIAIAVLNQGLRPFLSKWNRLLEVWEKQRDPKGSRRDHEHRWPHEAQFREESENLRRNLAAYAHTLARICGANPAVKT